MSKRKKQRAAAERSGQSAGDSALATRQCHPTATCHCDAPKKQPVLLAISAILFGLWFLFLVVTALRS